MGNVLEPSNYLAPLRPNPTDCEMVQYSYCKQMFSISDLEEQERQGQDSEVAAVQKCRKMLIDSMDAGEVVEHMKVLSKFINYLCHFFFFSLF